MENIKNVDVATQANNVNLFNNPLQLKEHNVGVEIKVTGTDAPTKAILATSITGRNFSQPHDEAVIEIPAGDQTLNVLFEGVVPGHLAGLYFDKLTATQGTLEAAIG